MSPKHATSDALEILDRRFGAQDPNWQRDVRQAEAEIAVGQQIRALRKKRGLSQAQLAQLADTSVPAISRIENADYDGHSLKVLRKLARLMDARLHVSFEATESAKRPSPPPGPPRARKGTAAPVRS